MTTEYLLLFGVVGVSFMALIGRIGDAMLRSYLLESAIMALPFG